MQEHLVNSLAFQRISNEGYGLLVASPSAIAKRRRLGVERSRMARFGLRSRPTDLVHHGCRGRFRQLVTTNHPEIPSLAACTYQQCPPLN